MTAYYVATLARYVVVEAENEAQTRERGAAAPPCTSYTPTCGPSSDARCRSRSVPCVRRPRTRSTWSELTNGCWRTKCRYNVGTASAWSR